MSLDKRKFSSFLRNNSFYLVLLLFVLTTNCDSNFLQTVPGDSVSGPTFWQTEEDARIAVNDLYNYLYGTEILTWDNISEISTANKPFTEAVTNPAPYERSTHSSVTALGNDQWYRNYRGIRAANNMLTKVEGIEADNPELINRYKAEARFIRAYLYTYLAFWFGDVPLLKKSVAIEESKNVARTSQSEVWDFISAELQEISEILPVNYGGGDQGRITKGAALAMKARAMLWAGRFDEAQQAAKAVMDLGEYDLNPSYKNLFSYDAEDNQEVILDKNFIRNEFSNQVFNIIGPRSQQNANSEFVPTKNIVDAYEMTSGLPIDDPDSGFDPRNPYANRDPRLGYSIFLTGDTLPDGQTYDARPGFEGSDDVLFGLRTTNTGFNIEKYVNPEDLSTPGNCGIDIILIRYAEVLLTYAEAKIEAGDIDQSVYDAINEVRERPDVDMPPIDSGKAQDELRQIVRHERMVELAFEGKHFFDIRRWETAEELLDGTIYGMTYVGSDGELNTVQFQEFTRGFRAPRDYLWPLPQKEVELTAMEQNSGYE